MALRITPYALTDVGRQRDNNEDAFDVMPEEEFYVVADGMGGHASGQVASRVAVESIRKYMGDLRKRPGHELTYPTPETYGPPEKLLSNAIQWANERVFIESMKDRKLEGMGTTIVCVLGFDRWVVLGHVGDSRIYRFRDGQVKQVTRDHSLFNHLIDQGKLRTDAEKKSFKDKNIILKALGLKDYVEPEVNVLEKQAGDIYVLCSDGLSDQVDDWILANVLESETEDLDRACQTLVRLANEAGGKDNCTVMLLHLEEATSPALAIPAEKPTVLFDASTRITTHPDSTRPTMKAMTDADSFSETEPTLDLVAETPRSRPYEPELPPTAPLLKAKKMPDLPPTDPVVKTVRVPAPAFAGTSGTAVVGASTVKPKVEVPPAALPSIIIADDLELEHERTIPEMPRFVDPDEGDEAFAETLKHLVLAEDGKGAPVPPPKTKGGETK